MTFAATVGALPPPPAPQGRVSDYAGVLAPAERARIEARLADYERESSNQIVVAVFPSLGGEDLEEFTNRFFERWRPGKKDVHNGILLAIFLEERRARIEVGYGLEARLTDALSRRILEQELAPRFRRGDYAGGIEAACDAIIAATRGEYRASPARRIPTWWPILLLVLLIVAVVILSHLESGTTYSRSGRRRFHPSGPGSWRWQGAGGFGRGGTSSRGARGGSGGFSGGGGLSGGGGASGSW